MSIIKIEGSQKAVNDSVSGNDIYAQSFLIDDRYKLKYFTWLTRYAFTFHPWNDYDIFISFKTLLRTHKIITKLFDIDESDNQTEVFNKISIFLEQQPEYILGFDEIQNQFTIQWEPNEIPFRWGWKYTKYNHYIDILWGIWDKIHNQHLIIPLVELRFLNWMVFANQVGLSYLHLDNNYRLDMKTQKYISKKNLEDLSDPFIRYIKLLLTYWDNQND
jgi:hypothetical protein